MRADHATPRRIGRGARQPGAMPAVTVVVLTLNEATRLAACLDSVGDLTDQIVVVDSLSSDGTVELARRYTDRVLSRAWTGRQDAVRLGVDSVGTEWTLILDADEVATPEFRAAVARAVTEPGVDGYTVGRQEEFLGRRIRCGHHASVLRLARTAAIETPPQRAHAPITVPGRVRPLVGGELIHRVDQPLRELFGKWTDRAWLAACDQHDRGRRASVRSLVWRPFMTLVRLWLLKCGFLDGVPGLIFCGLRTWYSFAREAHLWALQHGGRAGR